MRLPFPPLELGVDQLNLRGRWALRQAAEEAYARKGEELLVVRSFGCGKRVAGVYTSPHGPLFVSDPLARATDVRVRAEIARGLIPEGRELMAFGAKFQLDVIGMDIAEQNKLVEEVWWQDKQRVLKVVQGWKHSPPQPAHGPAIPLILDLARFSPSPGIEPWHPSRLATFCPACAMHRDVAEVDRGELVRKLERAKLTGERQKIYVRVAQRL